MVSPIDLADVASETLGKGHDLHLCRLRILVRVIGDSSLQNPRLPFPNWTDFPVPLPRKVISKAVPRKIVAKYD